MSNKHYSVQSNKLNSFLPKQATNITALKQLIYFEFGFDFWRVACGLPGDMMARISKLEPARKWIFKKRIIISFDLNGGEQCHFESRVTPLLQKILGP